MSQGFHYRDALTAYQALSERPLPEATASATEILHSYHPDYYEDAVVKLRIGTNKGAICHRDLARVLEADARIDEADLAAAPIVDTDVLVIGGGGAGCTAALTASRAGAKVIMATKLRLGDSNTVMAEGGIQASINKGDTPQMHFDDTLKGGHLQVNRELAGQMVSDAPDVIR